MANLASKTKDLQTFLMVKMPRLDIAASNGVNSSFIEICASCGKLGQKLTADCADYADFEGKFRFFNDFLEVFECF